MQLIYNQLKMDLKQILCKEDENNSDQGNDQNDDEEETQKNQEEKINDVERAITTDQPTSRTHDLEHCLEISNEY